MAKVHVTFDMLIANKEGAVNRVLRTLQVLPERCNIPTEFVKIRQSEFFPKVDLIIKTPAVDLALVCAYLNTTCRSSLITLRMTRYSPMKIEVLINDK